MEKMKRLIPPHMFQIPIQVAIDAQIIARETVPTLRKDVTAMCYSGDATRKRKLDTQKEGKKRMRHPAGGVYRGIEDGCGLRFADGSTPSVTDLSG